MVLMAEMRTWAKTMRRKASPRRKTRSASALPAERWLSLAKASRSETMAPITMPISTCASMWPVSLPIRCSSAACSRSQWLMLSRTTSVLFGRKSASHCGSVARELSRISAILASRAARLPPSLFMKATIAEAGARYRTDDQQYDEANRQAFGAASRQMPGKERNKRTHQLINQQAGNQRRQQVKLEDKEDAQYGQGPGAHTRGRWGWRVYSFGLVSGWR